MSTQAERQELIAQLRNYPEELAALVRSLPDDVLTARPLEGEWSVAQNVHHVVDSHMNAYIRFKLILTEEHPTLKPYAQELWAELPDSTRPNIYISLDMLRGLHDRWATIMESLTDEQWQRTGFHPDNGKVTLASILASYVNHGNAHIDQINRTLAAQTGS